MPQPVAHYTAAWSIMVLALTSEWFQWLLGSVVFQFMGKISFCLYLFHELFTDWAEVDTYYYFMGQGLEANEAIFVTWLIYTPLLILISWGLTELVDLPAKEFAYEVDI